MNVYLMKKPVKVQVVPIVSFFHPNIHKRNGFARNTLSLTTPQFGNKFQIGTINPVFIFHLYSFVSKTDNFLSWKSW